MANKKSVKYVFSSRRLTLQFKDVQIIQFKQDSVTLYCYGQNVFLLKEE